MQVFLLSVTGMGLAMASLSVRLFFGKEILFKGNCGRLKLPGLVDDHEKCGSCSEAEEEETLAKEAFEV